MIKITTFLIVCFYGTCLFAQTEELKFTKHAFGLTYSSNYSFRVLKENKNYANPAIHIEDFIRNRNKSESGGFGFNLGISYLFQFHKNIALESGVLYTGYLNKTQNIEIMTFENGDFIDIGDLNLRSSLRTFSIPLKVNAIILNKKKWRLFAQAGIFNDFAFNKINKANITFLEAGYDTSIPKRSKGDLINLKYLMGLTTGFGLDYFPIDQLLIRVEPNTKNLFFSNMDTPIKELPFSLGCSIGMFWRFGF